MCTALAAPVAPGNTGARVSLMSPSGTGLLRQIQRLVVAPLERVTVPGIADTETQRVTESATTHTKKVHSAVPVATRRGQHGHRGTYARARGNRTDGRRPISVARLS